MAYEPMKLLDPVREEPEMEGSGTDVESGNSNSCASPADEALSFLRWKLMGEPQENYNPAHLLSRKEAGHLFNAICTSFPWLINMILMVAVVVLALRLDSRSSAPGLPPTNVMYSKWSGPLRLEIQPKHLLISGLR